MYEERYGKSFIPADMTIQDWGITYDELEPYYDRFEYTAAVSGKAGNIKGADPARRQSVRGAARARLSAAAAHPDPGERGLHAGREQHRLSPVPAAFGQRVARLHQSGRLEIRRVPVLRLLPAFRLRGQRQGQPAHHGDPDRDAQSELRAAHPFVGDEGAEGFRRQARHRRDLHQRAQRRGIRAAGRHRAAVRLRDQQRAPDAAVAASASPTIRSRRPA